MAFSPISSTPSSSYSFASSSSSSEINLHAPDDAPDAHFSPKFDKHGTDSDLILESSDHVLFRVHKARLIGSTVFRDMFELGDYAHEVSTDIAPLTVALSEPARTLENILPFFYDDFPDVDDLPFQEVLDAFEAGAKYGMNLVEHIYAARLRRMMPKGVNAQQAYELWKRCVVLDKPDMAAQALQLTGKGNIMQFSTSDITSLPPRDVDNLWRTHMHHAQSSVELLFKYAWQSARGTCFYFNQEKHARYIRGLLLAKTSGTPVEVEEPVGFATCPKCQTMARELGII